MSEGGRILDGVQAFPQLEDAWRALYGRMDWTNPFLSFEWTDAYLRTYGERRPVLFWIYEVDGAITAIAPLQREGRGIVSLSHPDLNDYCGVLTAAPSTAMAQALLADLAAASRGGVRIPLLRDDAPLAAQLRAQFAARGGNFEIAPHTTNPLLPIADSLQAVMAARSKKLRQDVRTTMNHLKRAGSWAYESSTAGPLAEEIYDALMQFHLARQEDKAGHSIFADARNAAFLKQILGRLEPGVSTHMSALRLNGRIISAAYSLIAGRTLFYWVPSFDASMPSLSLGKLQIAEVIRDALARGVDCFDFMGGEESYKFQWTNTAVPIHEWVMYSGILERLSVQWRRRARDAAKRAVGRSALLQRLSARVR